MVDENNIFDDLQSLFSNNPQNFNIIEEQIDIDLQMSYFKRSKRLKKKSVKLSDVMEKVPQLYDETVRIEEKRDILMYLASFEEVEAFRVIEAFWKIADGEIKPWASMAYRESKMMLESSLLDQKQILISTGLGGKGIKLRYFMVFIHSQNSDFSETQQKVVKSEMDFVLQKHGAEIESVVFDEQFAKIFVLIPIQIAVKDVVYSAVTECNQYGNFLSENFLITNVKELENEEIYQIILAQNEQREHKELFGDDDEFDDFDDFDENDDDDDE